ncbi:MAG: DUF349 domain-containing protein [Propionibacteriaceae bacterium]|nr:DUF349 domain-containing protein [Propionibacteriaceae bacterium]
MEPDEVNPTVIPAPDNEDPAPVILREVAESRIHTHTTDTPSPKETGRAATRTIKEALIAQAELVAMISPAKTAPGEMKALLEQWKLAGRTTKSEDNALWERFRLAQDQLFTRLDLLRDQRQTEAAEATVLKESLIATAEELAGRSDVRQSVETMASLMATWKTIGRASDDKALWLRFKAAQDQVYARRNEERSKSADDQRESARVKKDLIEQVRVLVGEVDLSHAHSEVKRIQIAFRESGYSGKDKNASLGKEFREVIQEFYTWARKEPDRRKESGQQGTYGRRARLSQQITKVKTDLAHAEQKLATTDPAGAKKSHGSGVVLTLGAGGAYSSAAAEVMRLKIRLSDLESQVHTLDEKLGRESA